MGCWCRKSDISKKTTENSYNYYFLMITIKMSIHHRRDSKQISYHQSFDGGEYTIEYSESLTIMVDGIERLDLNTLAILNCYCEQHSSQWTNSDVSWFDVCNNVNQDVDEYCDLESSKELFVLLDSTKYTFILLTSYNELQDSFLHLEDVQIYYKKIFFNEIIESDFKYDNTVLKKNKEILDINSQILCLESNIALLEKKKKTINAEIEKLITEKPIAKYEIFKDAILKGNLSKFQKVTEYECFPIELALKYNDSTLFCFIISDIVNFKDFVEKNMQNVISIFTKYKLTSKMHDDIRSFFLYIFMEKANSTNDCNFVDLALPSGNKWAIHSIGYSTPYLVLDCPGTEQPFTIFSKNDIISLFLEGAYSIPSEEDFQELIDNCRWQWQPALFLPNGKFKLAGYNVLGSNGNRFFLRAAGFCDDTGKNVNLKEGYYWTNKKAIKDGENICFWFDQYGSAYTFRQFPSKNSLFILPIKRKSSI